MPNAMLQLVENGADRGQFTTADRRSIALRLDLRQSSLRRLAREYGTTEDAIMDAYQDQIRIDRRIAEQQAFSAGRRSVLIDPHTPARRAA